MDKNNKKALGEQPFTTSFDLVSGASAERKPTQRRLSNMKGMFADGNAYEAALAQGDPILYEFYELGLPEHPGDLAFGTSIVFPGKIGQEFYMTKGHFHTILDTAEVYYCLSGQGIMLMETPEGVWRAEEMSAGRVVYVSKRYAHRSINTGKDKLVTFFVFRADAGHNYSAIESKGYRKLVVERDGRPEIIANPRWNG
jgi:glucose-6-phosphate isomerase, archaeal